MKNQELFLNETNPLKKSSILYIKEMGKEINPIVNDVVNNSFLAKADKPYTQSIITRSVRKDRIEIW